MNHFHAPHISIFFWYGIGQKVRQYSIIENKKWKYTLETGNTCKRPTSRYYTNPDIYSLRGLMEQTRQEQGQSQRPVVP